MPLKCENHTAAIYDRGGMNILGVIDPLTRVRWERVRDDYSNGSIMTTLPTLDCLRLLDQVEPNRHELVVFRGGERVWEGPITRVARSAGGVEIVARDVIHYLYRTAMHYAYDNSTTNVAPVVDRAVNIITQELQRYKDALVGGADPAYNVLPHLRTVRYSDINLERRTTRSTPPFGGTVYDEIDEMSARGGLDYTALGRSIILNDVRVPIGWAPEVTEDDFIGDVIVTSYGMDSITRAITTGDEGMYGMAGGVDPYYGEWEYVDSMFDEDSVEAPSQNSLDNAAAYNMTDKLPVPVVVRIPENSQLNPNGVLTMEHLVPGVNMNLRASLAGVEVVQRQKLNSVRVEESADSAEKIEVSMVTAPRMIGEEA